MNVQSVTYAAGTTGDTLEVTLTNTGPSSVTIGQFSFGIHAGSSNVLFTGVDNGTTTAPYIFAGIGIGPNIVDDTDGVLPGPDTGAFDVANHVPFYATVEPGVTVGLGHVIFNLRATTPPGSIPLSFIPLDDSLVNPSGGLTFDVGSGTITVPGSVTATPEPATARSIMLALMGLTVGIRVKRRS